MKAFLIVALWLIAIALLGLAVHSNRVTVKNCIEAGGQSVRDALGAHRECLPQPQNTP